MSINKKSTKVTMSLKDYEELQSSENVYRSLIGELKRLAYIDEITSDSATIVIDKEKVEQFIYPFTTKDCELDGVEDSLVFKWK